MIQEEIMSETIKGTFNPAEAEKAQIEYCKAHNAPEFFPNHYIGYRCYRCNQNIFSEHGNESLGARKGTVTGRTRAGYSVEYASSHLITGCPFCYASYCD